MGHVVIGMDPHKRSATIEVIDDRERVLDKGRFGTDSEGYRAMLAAGRRHRDRVWAVEGCNGIGRHIAQRLVADGEPVVDVPAKLSARMRMFATGQGRKTDDTDAHSIALVGVRISGLQPVVSDDQLEMLRLLVDRRRRIGPGACHQDLSAPPTPIGACPGRGEEGPVRRPGPQDPRRRATW